MLRLSFVRWIIWFSIFHISKIDYKNTIIQYQYVNPFFLLLTSYSKYFILSSTENSMYDNCFPDSDGSCHRHLFRTRWIVLLNSKFLLWTSFFIPWHFRILKLLTSWQFSSFEHFPKIGNQSCLKRLRIFLNSWN